MHDLILLGIGFLAAFVGSMSGGGAGLITLFTLISLGMPLNAAIATNKVGDLGFFFPVLRNFSKAKQVTKKTLIPIVAINLMGVVIGTLLVTRLNETTLTWVVAGVLLLLIIAAFFRKNDALKQRPPRPFWQLIYFGASVSTGALGAGTGIISTMILINSRGFSALQAMAHSFYANMFGCTLSAAILLFSGLVNYRYAILLFIGNTVGAHFGSKIAIKRGNAFVRYMILALAICVLLQIIFL